MCVVLDDVSPQHNQSCDFCDAYRLHPLQAVLMIILKAKLVKKCSTTTLMHRLSQFAASEDGIPTICKHTRSQTCMHAL